MARSAFIWRPDTKLRRQVALSVFKLEGADEMAIMRAHREALHKAIGETGFEIVPWYRPVSGSAARFETAIASHPSEARVLGPGESFEPAVVPTAS